MQKKRDNIKCDCGYENHVENLKKYGGRCLRCKKLLDPKAEFEQQMYRKLGMTRELKRKGRIYGY